MINWFHKLFNPHCPDCITERVCNTCEVLRHELEIIRLERDKLLSKLIDKPIEPVVEHTEVKPIMPHAIPWKVRRQMLEAEDREKAKLIAIHNEVKSVQELENKVLGNADQS